MYTGMLCGSWWDSCELCVANFKFAKVHVIGCYPTLPTMKMGQGAITHASRILEPHLQSCDGTLILLHPQQIRFRMIVDPREVHILF